MVILDVYNKYISLICWNGERKLFFYLLGKIEIEKWLSMFILRFVIFLNCFILNFYFVCVFYLFGIDGLLRFFLIKIKWWICNMCCVVK